MANKYNYVSTAQGLNINYPTDMAMPDESSIAMFVRMSDDGKKPFVTDDGKYLLANGRLFVYVEASVAQGLEFKVDAHGANFTVVNPSAYSSAVPQGAPSKLKF